MNAKLTWSSTAKSKRKQMFDKVQDYVDKQCGDKMRPYVPVGLPKFKHSGKLRDSVKIPTPGKIIYTAPFSKSDYYSTVNHKHGGNPNARRMWFEHMKSKHKKEIQNGVSEITKKGI